MVRHGGWAFAEDPSRPARSARLFWKADHDPRVIRASAEPATSREGRVFDLLAQPIPATVLVERDGIEQLLLGDGERTLRIALQSGTFLDGPVRLRHDLPDDDHFDRRLLALERWSAFVRLGRFPARLYPPLRRARRWIEIIRAANAMAHRDSMRDIAIHLGGIEIIDAKWTSETDDLRARIRRVTGSARALASGGYLDLLRL